MSYLDAPAPLRQHVPANRNRPSSLRVTEITVEARGLQAFDGHEKLFEVNDTAVGLTAFIAVHDTTLGPALGGCRALSYPTRAAALTDALRLSRGMTHKSAVADLDLGGGKAVILLERGGTLTETMCRSFGQAVDSLDGLYITGEDAGTSVREMDWINRETPHVIGTSARGGDPSAMTALGVVAGIRAAVRHRLGLDGLKGITVAVQGLGHVGARLCQYLSVAGARLIVTDIVPQRVDAMVSQFGAYAVSAEEIHRVRSDVFAPCGLGAIINRETIPRLACSVVAGSANNQLDGVGDGPALQQRNILYAPDYVINAGGLISAAMGLLGREPNGPETRERVERIGEVLSEIFRRSAATGSSPEAIAEQMARGRLAGRKRVGSLEEMSA